ncbi:MAG: hypothetical protein AAF608_12180 [Pseudomonadota bacterium]
MSCGGATSEHEPERASRTCIVNYSVSPLHGGARMGDQRRDILKREMGGGFADSSLARDLDAFSAQMIEELRRDLTLPPFRIEQVRGGYKGSTSDSLTATARFIGDADPAAFSHLTSAIGYVFMQDGMILQCSLGAESDEEHDRVPALVLRDVGTRDDLNIESVGALYADMLNVTGFDELGFTYDPAEDTLTILVFSADGAPEREAMAWALDTLNREGTAAEVVLGEEGRSVSFLGHRWEEDAAGTTYAQLLRPAFDEQLVSLRQLDQYQQTYLTIIDTYTDQ